MHIHYYSTVLVVFFVILCFSRLVGHSARVAILQSAALQTSSLQRSSIRTTLLLLSFLHNQCLCFSQLAIFPNRFFSLLQINEQSGGFIQPADRQLTDCVTLADQDASNRPKAKHSGLEMNGGLRFDQMFWDFLPRMRPKPVIKAGTLYFVFFYVFFSLQFPRKAYSHQSGLDVNMH